MKSFADEKSSYTNNPLLSKKEELDVEFCKQYDSIRPNTAAPFVERMKFDIYKRATKDTRLEKVKKMTKVTLSEQDKMDLIERMEKDASRRREAQKIVENKVKEEPKSMGQKRLSREEGEELYKRLMKSKEINENILNEKRMLNEEIKNQEELLSLESQVITRRGIDKD